MRFRFLADDLDPDRTVCVDGVAPARLNLSHWPGQRTPPALRDDLSTGIALNLAEHPDREAFLDGIEVVTNTHFDTDGVLSAFAVLNPEKALAHRGLLLDAARTGDFQVFTSAAALAMDLTLTAIGDHIAREAFPSETEMRQRQYEKALAAVPVLLENPFRFSDEVSAELDRVLSDLDDEDEVRVDVRETSALAIVVSTRPLHRIAINTLAGDRYRVLHAVPVGRGHLYRLHERVESWFDLVTIEPPKRRDWTALRDRLEDLEAPEAEPHWIATPIDLPVPELYFGIPGEGRGFGGPPPGETCASRLTPRIVVSAVEEHYARELA